jgi:hypothetical protein
MEDYHEIIPRIYLGGSDGSKDSSFIKGKKISVILNCTKDLPNHFEPLFIEPIENAPEDVQKWIGENLPKYYRLPIDDNMKDVEIERFYEYSKKIIPIIIKHYYEGKNIFVHCLAGAQRSAAFVALLLTILEKISMEDAIDKIIKKRRQAFCFGMQINFHDAIQKYISFSGSSTELTENNMLSSCHHS